MNTLKPGDVLVLLDDDGIPPAWRGYIGQECRIISVDNTRVVVKFADGWAVGASLLLFRRKSEHPREYVRSWDSGPWIPKALREKRQ